MLPNHWLGQDASQVHQLLSDWFRCFPVVPVACWVSPVLSSIRYPTVSFLPHIQAMIPCDTMWGSCCFVSIAYVWGFVGIPSNLSLILLCISSLFLCRDWGKFKSNSITTLLFQNTLELLNPFLITGSCADLAFPLCMQDPRMCSTRAYFMIFYHWQWK